MFFVGLFILISLGKCALGLQRITDSEVLMTRTNQCGQEVIPECLGVCTSYIPWNVNTAYCTKRKSLGGTYIYWYLLDSASWSMSELACQDGGGHLASFPDLDSMFFATSYVRGYTVGAGPGFNPSNLYSNAVWVGLEKRPNNVWYWKTGTAVSSRYPIPWNVYAGYIGTTNRVTPGTCGLLAYSGDANPSNYAAGYIKANCDTTAAAVCSKKISN